MQSWPLKEDSYHSRNDISGVISDLCPAFVLRTDNGATPNLPRLTWNMGQRNGLQAKQKRDKNTLLSVHSGFPMAAEFLVVWCDWHVLQPVGGA